MIIKNPYRMTRILEEQRKVKTTYGEIPYILWCNLEAQRLVEAGIPAKVRRKKDKKSGTYFCWVVRTSIGVVDAEDAENADDAAENADDGEVITQ